MARAGPRGAAALARNRARRQKQEAASEAAMQYQIQQTAGAGPTPTPQITRAFLTKLKKDQEHIAQGHPVTSTAELAEARRMYPMLNLLAMQLLGGVNAVETDPTRTSLEDRQRAAMAADMIGQALRKAQF